MLKLVGLINRSNIKQLNYTKFYLVNLNHFKMFDIYNCKIISLIIYLLNFKTF